MLSGSARLLSWLLTAENMAAVIGKDGVETEIQVGQMRQTLGKPGFDWLFNKH